VRPPLVIPRTRQVPYGRLKRGGWGLLGGGSGESKGALAVGKGGRAFTQTKMVKTAAKAWLETVG